MHAQAPIPSAYNLQQADDWKRLPAPDYGKLAKEKCWHNEQKMFTKKGSHGWARDKQKAYLQIQTFNW